MSKSFYPINRAVITVGIIVSAFLFSWWVPCIASLVALVFFDFAEIILVGAIIDVLYGSQGFWRIAFSLIAFAIFALSLYLKPRLSLYNPLS